MSGQRGMFDLAVIGGGINGCGIARDAAGRGLSVLLLEQGDLAGATSSASTKLIHGGLRYLEHREFRLVRESLRRARGAAARRAAHRLAAPLRAAAPQGPAPLAGAAPRAVPLRPSRRPQASCRRRARSTSAPIPPARRCSRATRARFEYSDCWVDDARLVVLAARDAADRGADIRTRTRCVAARRAAIGAGSLTLQRQDGGTRNRRGPRARQCRRPVGLRRSWRASSRMNAPTQGAARQGQPHRRAPRRRARSLLHLPERATAASASPSRTSRTSR